MSARPSDQFSFRFIPIPGATTLHSYNPHQAANRNVFEVFWIFWFYVIFLCFHESKKQREKSRFKCFVQLFQRRKNSSAVIIEKRFRICTSLGRSGHFNAFLLSSMLTHARIFQFLQTNCFHACWWNGMKMRDEQKLGGKRRTNRCLGLRKSSRQLTKQEESNYDVCLVAVSCVVPCVVLKVSSDGNVARKLKSYLLLPSTRSTSRVACLWTTKKILCNVSQRC